MIVLDIQLIARAVSALQALTPLSRRFTHAQRGGKMAATALTFRPCSQIIAEDKTVEGGTKTSHTSIEQLPPSESRGRLTNYGRGPKTCSRKAKQKRAIVSDRPSAFCREEGKSLVIYWVIHCYLWRRWSKKGQYFVGGERVIVRLSRRADELWTEALCLMFCTGLGCKARECWIFRFLFFDGRGQVLSGSTTFCYSSGFLETCLFLFVCVFKLRLVPNDSKIAQDENKQALKQNRFKQHKATEKQLSNQTDCVVS